MPLGTRLEKAEYGICLNVVTRRPQYGFGQFSISHETAQQIKVPGAGCIKLLITSLITIL